MRVLQGALAGVAVGSFVGWSTGVLRPWSGALAGVLLVLAALVSISAGRREGRQRAAARRSNPVTAAVVAAPGGFFTGRRLGDALAWLAAEHAVAVLERVAVTEDALAVLGPGPQGPRLAEVTERDGAFAVEFADLPTGEPSLGSARFQARDVAPDVLPRALERARREHPATWTEVVDPEAVLLRPDRLRDEVTVQLHNGSLTGLDQTLWASAAGDVLFVQESLS
ncbi:hypothetical protein [Klenkia sp. PcliD-1-E]|uniref:hypothetical protein n=1 Tax=Klenkia sp. PcliD-1-E TaxID=2954492 RepID=UPI002096ABDF|nr:hypothetical protein [Klenkia sp. PcliD-1-E]MCO7221352.1 hypothetical protein [Klenkia sp. PcliD-1-E]